MLNINPMSGQERARLRQEKIQREIRGGKGQNIAWLICLGIMLAALLLILLR